MKILYVGKFFPIQGGEASKAYWLLKKFVEYGHEVIILTDSRGYSEDNLCISSDSDKDILNIFHYFDARWYAEQSVYEIILKINTKVKADVIIGWYLYPYAFEAIKAGNKLGIPVVVQHAGSDIKRLQNEEKLQQLDLIEQLNCCQSFWSYPDTVDILNKLNIKNISKHYPLIPSDFYNLINKNNNFDNRLLVLGAKNKSKGYNKIVDRATRDKVKIDWFGVGNKEQFEYLKNYQSNACWNIPNIIKNYNALLYVEDNFSIETHKSRIPLEALATGTLVILQKELMSEYVPYSEFMIGINIEQEHSLRYAINYIDSKEGLQKREKLKEFLKKEKYDDSIWYENREIALEKVISLYKTK